MKKCNKCGVIKELIEYATSKLNKDGRIGNCKKCQAVTRLENKESMDLYMKVWRQNNPDKTRKYVEVYARNYYNENKEVINDYHKLRNQTEEVKSKKKILRDKKYNNDPSYRLKLNIRSLIGFSFKTSGFKKNTKTEYILGCTFIEFKLYLESKFEPWMTWENKGLYNGEFNYGWDTDHIIPISSAKTEEDIIRLNHFSNFQPLCSKVNRDIKKNKLDY